MLADPYAAVRKLHADLRAAGMIGLTLPTEEKVTSLLRPSTAAQPLYLLSERKTVGEAAGGRARREKYCDAPSLMCSARRALAAAAWGRIGHSCSPDAIFS